MIVRLYRYKASRADRRRLARHLLKKDGQRPELVGLRNLWVRNMVEGMAVMVALKAGAPKASISFWHIIVSPVRTLSPRERRRVIALILEELGAEDHPLMAFSHEEKPRARKGGGGNHLHIVLGHVSPRFRALDMRHYLPRLHKVMARASYEIEGMATPSPYHRSIIKKLSKEAPHVARWLLDELGDAPVMKKAPMRDSMRRAAQAADFDLPWFQAELKRLWASEAAQSRIETFLRENGVVAREGLVDGVIAFYGSVFAGALHRILQRDVISVREEAKVRIPRILRQIGVEHADLLGSEPELRGQDEQPISQKKRSFRLRRQRMVDYLEDQLACLRTERLKLIYGSGDPPLDLNSSEPADVRCLDNYRNFVQGGPPAGASSDHINQLLEEVSVLEAAVSLCWNDERWVERSAQELLEHVAELMKGPNVDASSETDETGHDEPPEEPEGSTTTFWPR